MRNARRKRERKCGCKPTLGFNGYKRFGCGDRMAVGMGRLVLSYLSQVYFEGQRGRDGDGM